MKRPSHHGAIAALTALLCCLGEAVPSPDAEDISVSSEIANTMAAITGRANRVLPRTPPKPHKLGLSKLKTEARHQSKAKVDLLKKAEAPKQLSGYLGWSKPAKQSFSTNWKTTGENAAKSLYMRDLEEGHPQVVAAKRAQKKQALVSGQAVTTAFSKMLEHQLDEDNFPAIDWGSKKSSKLALKAQATHTSSNGYLDAVGWTSPEVVKAEDNSYLRTLKADPTKKKFLAAAEVSETQQTGSKNKYFDSLMPKYFDVGA